MSAQHALYNKTMFGDISLLFREWVIGLPYINIPVAGDFPALAGGALGVCTLVRTVVSPPCGYLSDDKLALTPKTSKGVRSFYRPVLHETINTAKLPVVAGPMGKCGTAQGAVSNHAIIIPCKDAQKWAMRLAVVQFLALIIAIIMFLLNKGA